MIALSNLWFGARLRRATEQVEAAAALGFEAVSLARTDPVPSFEGLEDGVSATGVRVVLVEAGCLGGRGVSRETAFPLADPDEGVRDRAVEEVLRHVPLGRAAGCGTFSIPVGAVARAEPRRRAERAAGRLSGSGREEARPEPAGEVRAGASPSREASLERLCRSFHALATAEPGALFCLETPSSPDAVVDLEGASLLLDDLRRKRVGYVHDVAQARILEKRGAPPAGVWLERFVDRLAAVRLHDVEGIEMRRPPGAGEVDFRPVRNYLRKDVARVLVLDSRFDRTALLESLRYLRNLGI